MPRPVLGLLLLSGVHRHVGAVLAMLEANPEFVLLEDDQLLLGGVGFAAGLDKLLPGALEFVS